MNAVREFLLKFLFRTAYNKIVEQKSLIDEMTSKHIGNGYHLKEELFLPEELGFELHEFYDDTIGYVNVYTKNGWRVIPDLKSDIRGYYSIETPGKCKLVVFLSNSYDAIMFFQALGMDISIDTIMRDHSILDKMDRVLGSKKLPHEA